MPDEFPELNALRQRAVAGQLTAADGKVLQVMAASFVRAMDMIKNETGTVEDVRHVLLTDDELRALRERMEANETG